MATVPSTAQYPPICCPAARRLWGSSHNTSEETGSAGRQNRQSSFLRREGGSQRVLEDHTYLLHLKDLQTAAQEDDQSGEERTVR